ncbi:porphobilinogen deaminase isoform X4 [Bombina bombina]|uniref:porphobilinogen deaminase isoform X4 n=1 Tax=Bombina bombina TaxID=8345 RepID=UPI00235A8461|nr:porphobilinogen deaminase isoform X4 [Bombina bombina]
MIGWSRFKRCILDSAHAFRIPPLSSVPLKRRTLAIHMSPLRPQFSSLVFHQDYETGCSLPSNQGHQAHPLSLDDILILAQDKSLLLNHLEFTTNLLQHLGFVINHDKSLLLSRFHSEFNNSYRALAAGQTSHHSKGTQISSEETTCEDHKAPILLHSGNFPRSLILQGHAEIEALLPTQRPFLCPTSNSLPRGQTGDIMVASQYGSLEWQGHFRFLAGFRNIIRCQPDWLGRILRLSGHRGQMDSGEVLAPYQLSGTHSRSFCHLILQGFVEQLLCPNPYGQHLSCPLYQQTWRYQVTDPRVFNSTVLPIFR